MAHNCSGNVLDFRQPEAARLTVFLWHRTLTLAYGHHAIPSSGLAAI